MKLELKSIGVWAFFKVSFIFNLAFGFIIGIIYVPFLALFMAGMSTFTMFQGEEFDTEGFSLVGMFIFVPIAMSIFMAVINTIVGLIGLGIYNLIAKLIGGFEFTFNQSEANSFKFEPAHEAPPVYAQAAPAPRPYSPPPPPVSDNTGEENYPPKKEDENDKPVF